MRHALDTFEIFDRRFQTRDSTTDDNFFSVNTRSGFRIWSVYMVSSSYQIINRKNIPLTLKCVVHEHVFKKRYNK